MKCKQILAVTAVWFMVASGIANAFDVTLSVNNQGSFSEHAVTVQPGDTFSIDITVTTTVEIFDMNDMKLLADSAGVLTVTDGSVQAPWTERWGTPVPVGELNPQSAGFGVTLPYPDVFGPGETALVTLDLTVNGNASPGTWTLNVIDGTYTACRVCPAFGFADSGPDFLIEIVERTSIPTVSHWGLVALALLLLVGVKIKFGRRPVPYA